MPLNSAERFELFQKMFAQIEEATSPEKMLALWNREFLVQDGSLQILVDPLFAGAIAAKTARAVRGNHDVKSDCRASSLANELLLFEYSMTLPPPMVKDEVKPSLIQQTPECHKVLGFIHEAFSSAIFNGICFPKALNNVEP